MGALRLFLSCLLIGDISFAPILLRGYYSLPRPILAPRTRMRVQRRLRWSMPLPKQPAMGF